MDPLIPTTSTLEPAIAHIAETAAALAETLHGRSEKVNEEGDGEAMVRKKQQRETVRWVLAAPDRLKTLVDEGRRQEAVEDWEKVRGLLGKWKGVEGADEVEAQCLKIMSEGTGSDAG